MPSKRTGSSVERKSSTTQPALPFSNDTGPTSPDGSTSTTSPLLPTPNAGTTPNGHGRRGGTKDNGHQSGADLEAVLMPTPTSGDAKASGHRQDERTPASHDGMTLSDWASKEALLPTPKAQEPGWSPDGDQDPEHRPYQDGQHRMWGIRQVVETLLPTVTGSDAKGRHFPSDKAPTLSDALLPTPNSALGSGGQTSRSRARKDEALLGDIEGLISSAAATPASPSVTPASAAAPMIRDTSGPSSPVLLASFDPDSHCWRMFQATLALELARYSQTLPRWGMTRRGSLYALPMSALRTVANDGSASLNVPTPTASDAVWADRDHSRKGIVGNHNLGLVDWAKMLPTPTGDDANNIYRASGDFQSLSRSVTDLLPTPKTPTGGPETRSSKASRGSGGADLAGSIGEITDRPSSDGNS